MGNLSQEYKNEIQEIFGEIYAKYIKEELQSTVDSEVTAKLKATADGISKQAEQAIRKEVERLSSKLKKGITDTIKAELLDLIRDAVPKEGKQFDYEKLTQMITNILDERKEARERGDPAGETNSSRRKIDEIRQQNHKGTSDCLSAVEHFTVVLLVV